jgi:glycosyltransferase involved in cell wall biosynthesis
MKKVLKELPRSFVVVKLWSSILACAMIDRTAGANRHVYNYCEDLDPADHADFIRFGKVKQRIVKQIFLSRELVSANTETVARSMVEQYGLKRRPAVIPSTVDIPGTVALAASDPQVFSSGRNVLTVGSLIRRKGLDIIQRALESVDVPFDWHIVGEGPMEAELRAYADPRGLLKIHLHGGHSNPYGYMQAADLLIHGARSEAWGIVLLESMAVGTPVLAARSIGPAEMQDKLGHGNSLMRTFDIGSSSDLARQLVENFPAGKVPLGEAHRYIAPFSLERAVDMWERRAAQALDRS